MVCSWLARWGSMVMVIKAKVCKDVAVDLKFGGLLQWILEFQLVEEAPTRMPIM